MIGNNFNSQIQTVIYDLLLKLMERQGSFSTGDDQNILRRYGDQGIDASNPGGSFSALINKAANKYGVNEDLVNAVIKAEI